MNEIFQKQMYLLKENTFFDVNDYYKTNIVITTFAFSITTTPPPPPHLSLGDINIFSSTYRDSIVSRFFFFHSRMTALGLVTTGMYPSLSITINRQFICIVCMYF